MTSLLEGDGSILYTVIILLHVYCTSKTSLGQICAEGVVSSQQSDAVVLLLSEDL